MPNSFIDNILAKINQPKLIETLTQKLSLSDLNSLLLGIFREKTKQITPPQLLQNYLSNRFVSPSLINPLDFLKFELKILEMADSEGFTPIELSPLSPLGACSVVASADQNKIVSALRGTEVTADATNLLALECAKIRKSEKFPEKKWHFATIHRHVRTQVFDFKGFSPHFKILGLVSAGRDTGSFEFEKQSIYQHLHFYTRYFDEYLPNISYKIRLKYLNIDNEENALAQSVYDFLKFKMPHLNIETIDNQQIAQNYYQRLQFKLVMEWEGQSYEIADGGIVDWTQKLTQNQKERFLISGWGIELLYKLIHKLL
jgi:hypothetical protein